MRVATCLPAATEIVCAVGGRATLVAVSHRCDWPRGPGGVSELPRLTASREAGAPVCDRTILAAAAPDLILTDDPAALGGELGGATLLTLRPRSLADVFADLVRVGDALGLGLTARAVVTGLRAQLQAVSERAAALAAPPRVALYDAPGAPPSNLGDPTAYPWLAELVVHAGGTLVTPPAAADVVLTLGPAARVYLTRPGPRLVDAVELLAAALHPTAFPELVRRHAHRAVRVTRADPSVPDVACDTS